MKFTKKNSSNSNGKSDEKNNSNNRQHQKKGNKNYSNGDNKKGNYQNGHGHQKRTRAPLTPEQIEKKIGFSMETFPPLDPVAQN